MASRKISKPVDPKQGNISMMFSKLATPAKKTEMATGTATTTTAVATGTLSSSDPEVQAFYNGLSANEAIAHTIAIDKLGTSYDVTRTHGFLRWKVMRK
jgi:hypothetical protein